MPAKLLKPTGCPIFSRRRIIRIPKRCSPRFRNAILARPVWRRCRVWCLGARIDLPDACLRPAAAMSRICACRSALNTRCTRPAWCVASIRRAFWSCVMDAVMDAVLIAEHLTKHYRIRRGLSGHGLVKALNDVLFSLDAGKTLAVVGESGCGKSTLARQLTMIETPTSGRVLIDGRDITQADRAQRALLRRRIQIIFQNPFASLNPRKTVKATLSEPLVVNTSFNAQQRAARIEAAMQTVGLRPEYMQRYPHMFSGGQRQRIAIARAMILEPGIVVADEPVSALDVSIQAQILNLLMDLQERFGTSYVFITHNLAVARHIAHTIIVMYLGGIVESGDTKSLFE